MTSISIKNRYRTHTCNDLRKTHIGEKVRLSGWVFRKRDFGQFVFVVLRDHYGLTQLVFRDQIELIEAAKKLRSETVIYVDGEVISRTENTINSKLPTGEVEVVVQSFNILSDCDILPISVESADKESEEQRLTYRFLDLRSERMHRNIKLRSDVIYAIRKKMVEMGFMEFQTPILTSSSPEGARDFLVPSRLHPGRFYALPQAPQQFKQLLMASGFDRYFQIAPCFRDEDARADRSPGEFYQLDIEMAFATQEDVFAVIEELFEELFSTFSSLQRNATPYPRLSWNEAMLKYGSDKPDLRIPIQIIDVSTIFENSQFKFFSEAVKKGLVVRGIPVKGASRQPRRFFEQMNEYAKSVGATGLSYIAITEDKPKGPLVNSLSFEEIDQIKNAAMLEIGDAIFFVCDNFHKASMIAGLVRSKVAVELDLIEKNVFRFCWVVDYPMFEAADEPGKIEFSHNPFSMPQGGLDALKNKNPLEILAYQYDIVCNGIELSSGAIRNHRPEIMYKAFNIVGYDEDYVNAKFGGMISAFRFGAPPHGGIAPGIDRIVMLLAGEENIREIIAFPLNQRGQDLMMKAPSHVSEKQLNDVHIKITKT